MIIIVPDVGEIYCLNRIRADWNTLFELRLFQNDYNPTADSLLPDFVESTFSGYDFKDLAGQWGGILHQRQRRGANGRAFPNLGSALVRR